MKENTKGGVLKQSASIFDTLVIISPITLMGKDMYRQACHWTYRGIVKKSTPFRRPTTGELSKDRAEGYRPFQVMGSDFAGPIIYKVMEKKGGRTLHYAFLQQPIQSGILGDSLKSNIDRVFEKFEIVLCKMRMPRKYSLR